MISGMYKNIPPFHVDKFPKSIEQTTYCTWNLVGDNVEIPIIREPRLLLE
jgi:hypothetical protein